MNTYTLSLSSTEPGIGRTLQTIELFDLTNFTVDLSDIYSTVFPNYIGIGWGDGTPLEEPAIKVFRDYKTESIYPEVLKGASPVYLNEGYSHLYFPSDFALKKSLTLRVNIGYITGETTKFSVPVNIRTSSYSEDVEDIEIIGIDLLNDENNSSRFTFLTKKDNYVVQMDNKSYKDTKA